MNRKGIDCLFQDSTWDLFFLGGVILSNLWDRPSETPQGRIGTLPTGPTRLRASRPGRHRLRVRRPAEAQGRAAEALGAGAREAARRSQRPTLGGSLRIARRRKLFGFGWIRGWASNNSLLADPRNPLPKFHNTVDGQTPFRTTLKPWLKPFFVGRISSIHSIASQVSQVLIDQELAKLVNGPC